MKTPDIRREVQSEVMVYDCAGKAVRTQARGEPA